MKPSEFEISYSAKDHVKIVAEISMFLKNADLTNSLSSQKNIRPKRH